MLTKRQKGCKMSTDAPGGMGRSASGNLLRRQAVVPPRPEDAFCLLRFERRWCHMATYEGVISLLLLIVAIITLVLKIVEMTQNNKKK